MTSSSATSQRTLVVGAGATGLSVLRHLYRMDQLTLIDTRGPDVFAANQRALLADVQCLLETDRALLEQQLDALPSAFDRAVISPGLSDDHWLLQRLRSEAVPMCTDIDLFFETAQAPVIGITGTNGKSTVTSLVAELLCAVGVDARAGGNLGPAALDILAESAQAYVLELSSFQLARSRLAPYRVASILNLHPDHLDYHGSMARYQAAKQRIYGAAEQAVFSREDEQTRPQGPSARPSSFGLDAPGVGEVGVELVAGERWLTLMPERAAASQRLLPSAELAIAGRHNERNALAAVAMVMALLPQLPALTSLATALRSFRGLPHRCERVATKQGVTYINDSKATNVGATVAAVEGLRGENGSQLLLLLGGDGKGADFSSLRAILSRGVRGAFVYGADAPTLFNKLSDVVPTVRCKTLAAAIDGARALAQPGDTVLLSPACASFDQFENYEARGEAFRQYVQALAA